MLTDGREGFVITSPNAVGELVAAIDRMTNDYHRLEMAAAASRLGQIQTLNLHVERLTKVFEGVAHAKSHAAKGPHLKKARATRPENVAGPKNL